VHAHDAQQDGQQGDRHRPAAGHESHADRTVFGPGTPEAVLALQQSVGNRVVARMLAGAGGTDPGVQRELVDAALRTPGSRLDEPRRTRLEEFHQTDLSAVRVHAGPVAQRSAQALGARAYTVRGDIVLGPGADTDEILGHETRHVVQQSTGPVAGDDNGAGLAVSDPANHEEREAATDGSAFTRGAEVAPSAIAQRTAGRPTTTPGAVALQRSGDEDQPDEKDDGQDDQEQEQDKKAKGKSKSKLVAEINDVVDEHTLAHGGGRHGRVTKGEVRLRFPRGKAQDRETQTLSHLSMLLHEALRTVQDDLADTESDIAQVNDREVQGMLVNDRLLFASNFNETIDRLRTRFGDQLVPLRDLLRRQRPDADRTHGLRGADATEYADRLRRAEQKVEAVFEGVRGEGDDATADAVRRSANRPVRIVDADAPDLRELLTSPEHQGAVLMIRYRPADRTSRTTGATVPGSMHAEQKLLVALHKAGLRPHEVTRPIAIAGKYRPCAGCAAALRYYKEAGGFTDLRYNVNAGHYYQESVNNLASHLRHVVEDPRYHEYMRDILDPGRGGAVSSAALSAQRPPDDVASRNGRELRIPAEDALGRGYVTASESEGELTDGEGGRRTYRRRERETFPYASGAARTIGPGRPQVTGGRRARRVLTDSEAEAMRQEWAAGDRDARMALLHRYARREGLPVSQAELREVTGASPSVLWRLIHNRTGHEARDSRAVAEGKKTRKRKRAGSPPAPKKNTFKKGGSLDARGEKEIRDAISEYRTFQEKWEIAGSPEPAKQPYRPSDMPEALTRTIADLRQRYTVTDMAKLLHFTEAALRKYLNRKHDVLNPKAPPEAPAEDVEMPDAPAAGDVEMGEPETDADEYPEEYEGYEHEIDLDTGEHFYYHEYTGLPHFYAGGTMVLLPQDRLAEVLDEPEAGPSGQAREPFPDAMDVDGEPPDTSEEVIEYVPARHGKGAPRRDRT
jgi:hypothetical protein